jgi:hypothetical protein
MMVVNLAVEDHPNGAIFVANWLMPPSDIDNAEAAHSEAAFGAAIEPFLVGTPVRDCITHCLQFTAFTARRAPGVCEADNAAHQ